jgi:branched-chain amino acid transport system permease protein
MIKDGITGWLSKNMPAGQSLGRFALWQTVAVLAAVVLLALCPLFLGNYRLNMLIMILSSAYLAQCWNLMSGYAGQFSFGHAAFYGLGAYTSSLLYTRFGVTPWAGMFVGMAVAGAAAALIGFLSFRYNLKGDYFALVTLAFAEIFRVIFNNTKALGAAGGVSIKFQRDWTVMQFAGKTGYFYMMLIMVLLLALAMYFLRRTKTGLYLVAIRENESAASALGINCMGYKMAAVVVSAMLAALGGTFYAQYYLFMDPHIVFSVAVSVSAITPCIIGGVGTVFGPIIGAFIIVPISELTNAMLGKYVGMNMVVYGAILVGAILLMPGGVTGFVENSLQKKSRKESQHGAS